MGKIARPHSLRLQERCSHHAIFEDRKTALETTTTLITTANGNVNILTLAFAKTKKSPMG